jgi:hypothetical protein
MPTDLVKLHGGCGQRSHRGTSREDLSLVRLDYRLLDGTEPS